MKKLYYSSCSYSAPHIGVVLDDIVSSLGKGDVVYWGYCHNALPSCWVNRNGLSSNCAMCHLMYKEYKQNYVKNAIMIPVKKSDFSNKSYDIQISDAQSVRSFEYRGVKVGMSVLSTYYSFTRDLDIADFEKFRNYCVPLLEMICRSVDFWYETIESLNPDEIIIFNGRHFSNRFLFDISRIKGIPFKSLEVVGNFNDPPFRKVTFRNNLPHSICLREEKIEKLWIETPDSFEKKCEIAQNFYIRRRNGELIADVKAYVTNQEKGLLPVDFDNSKRNVAIFNSSADEMAAIGGEWDENLLFDSQYEAIKYILENSNANIHYYLRIHPNLAGVNHKAHLDLYKLKEYKNITIIGPNEKISTYSLMEKCEKTVTFGSTMGVESCFWGKPSILIGHAAYEKLNVSYVPDSKEELMELLQNEKIEACPKDGALKYAYFLLDRKFSVEPTKIDINIYGKKYLFGFITASYLTLCKSKTLFQIIHFLLVRMMSRIGCFTNMNSNQIYNS